MDPHNNPQKRCNTTLLASGPFSSVEHCVDCDVYHLQVGPISFRMEAVVFESVCEMVLNLCLNRNKSTLHEAKGLQKH